MDYIELSDIARSICKTHYKKSCGICPLRPACVNKKYSGIPLSRELLDKETTEINELADKVSVLSDFLQHQLNTKE